MRVEEIPGEGEYSLVLLSDGVMLDNGQTKVRAMLSLRGMNDLRDALIEMFGLQEEEDYDLEDYDD